ncbi:hypothetical protein HK097_001533 [Rhizophlyctis rosea]|uniref:Aminotransferase class I/classII large domain-containing protein n=1 Tax=Rhizophlyctis rosea TaxID=64517 RepID=A0AAD5SHL8_9FUNG|nr:hypothetical protein HK097_001533 [Rhizophlyctis rosea]
MADKADSTPTTMTKTLASRLANIVPFHVMELQKMAAALEADGKSIIHLGIGEPDFTAPPQVIEAATVAMQNGHLQYTPALGILPLRQAISDHYRDVYGVEVGAERIVITAGASGALLLACAALVEKGSEVLMPDPCYPCNRHFVAAFEGRSKCVPCGPESRFQLTDNMVKNHWGPDTKGVLLASPSNPTGTSIPPSTLSSIINTVHSKNGFVIVDEIYGGLTYTNDSPKPFTALSLSSDIIIINSFSKYFHMTGWRLGYLIIPAALLPAIEKLSQNLFICPSVIAQHAALACFQPSTLCTYSARLAELATRRAFIIPALKSLGWEIPVEPDGAFYVYCDVSRWTADADSLTREILRDVGVVVVPGMDFGVWGAKKYVRVSYAQRMEKLGEAVERLRGFFEGRRPLRGEGLVKDDVRHEGMVVEE